MKITSVTATTLAIPYPYDGRRHNVAGKDWNTLDVLLVRVDTDVGLVGWGEAFGHGSIPATRAALESLVGPYMIGRDAADIAGTMRGAQQAAHIYGRGGPVTYALSGVDIALWDIAGKAAGLPLHRLLGAAAPAAVPAYASLLRYGDPVLVGRNVAKAVAAGYRAVKLHEITVAAVAAAREAAGPDVLLMNDTNCPWSPAEARAMARAFRPLDLHWLEEPVWPPEDFAGLAAVRAEGVPIAAGENMASAVEFLHAFQQGALDIAQPSVTKIGGVSEFRRVIALAELHGVRVVPHCAYFGPGFLASLHLVAAMPERPPLERLFLDLEASPLPPFTDSVGGTVPVPSGPGLGCDPDPAVIAHYEVKP
ncbi:MAG: mandelate racemase/muconate lactonizing enzyme family protein [Acetobacteraceae bacterium]